jgi:hypothetical protein
MAPGDPSAADCHEAVLYALLLSLMPGKVLIRGAFQSAEPSNPMS